MNEETKTKIKKIKWRIKKAWLKAFSKTFALAGALAFVWVFTHTFMMAFLSPSKTVLICIDKFGEALPELPLVIFVAINSTYWLLVTEVKYLRAHFRYRRRLEKRLVELQKPEEEIIKFIIEEENEEELPVVKAKAKNIPFQCPGCSKIFEVRPCRRPARVTCPYCKLHGLIE